MIVVGPCLRGIDTKKSGDGMFVTTGFHESDHYLRRRKNDPDEPRANDVVQGRGDCCCHGLQAQWGLEMPIDLRNATVNSRFYVLEGSCQCLQAIFSIMIELALRLTKSALEGDAIDF